MVYFIMTSLGELATFMPVSGSFCTYASRYVDPGFGFALGWTFWFSWATVVAVDVVAAQLVMAYWFPDSPGWIWSVAFLALTFGLNAFSARGFGESEYWFALIKVIAVLCFIVVGLGMLVGIIHSGDQIGLVNWSVGDAPFVGNFATWVGVAMVVAYSFQGTELVGVAAGESENPRRNVPRAINHVFWRILLFYVLAILIIGLLIPYTDPQLLRNEVGDIAVSPFTLVFQHAGLLSAATVMNAVILTSVLSAGNSGMYAATRMLFNMAVDGQAPAFFKRLTRGGVPRAAGHHRAGLPVHVQRGLQPQGGLHLAAELRRHDRVHRLAQHRGQPLPLPPGLCETGLRHRRPALQGRTVSLRPAAGLRAVPAGDAGPELPGLPGTTHRLDRRDLHLSGDPAVPGLLDRSPAAAQVALDSLRRHALLRRGRQRRAAAARS